MIIKKLAAPLINEKILAQAEHCYAATAAITEEAFDFMRTRLSPKCKIEVVTGLDGLTSPGVLRKTWRHYHDRITINIYTRNFFHANVFIFDLPYRKSVAFVGSGQLTLGGIKDNEEIFYKITDPKEIEGLKSWFTGYYEFSEPLTENIVTEYELIYPSMHQRVIASRQEKEQMMALTSHAFNWESIRFKNQYFKKDDYLTFASGKASLNTMEIQAERIKVKDKFLHLHSLIKERFADLGLYENGEVVSSVNPVDHPDRKLRSMAISYGRSRSALDRYHSGAKADDFMTMQFIIQQKDVGIWLLIGKPNGSKADREFFKQQMENAEYRTTFFKMVQALGIRYWMEVAGEKKAIQAFQTEDTLWEFTRADDWRYYSFIVGKNFEPGDPDISNDAIATTIFKESEKLIPLYRHLTTKN